MCNLSYGVKAEGIRIGEILVLTKLVKKGYITVEEAANEVDMTDQEFKEMIENPPT